MAMVTVQTLGYVNSKKKKKWVASLDMLEKAL